MTGVPRRGVKRGGSHTAIREDSNSSSPNDFQSTSSKTLLIVFSNLACCHSLMVRGEEEAAVLCCTSLLDGLFTIMLSISSASGTGVKNPT